MSIREELTMLKISVLIENRDNGCFVGEGGLSLVVEKDKDKFLIDTGLTDLFAQNAKKLNINLDNVNKVIFTHGHSDHTGGAHLLQGKDIIMHPQGFKPRWSKRKKEFVGLPINQETLKQHNNILLTQDAVEFIKDCYFLGEIPMITTFEKGNFSTTLDEALTQTDYTEDDSGVVIKTNKGLFIITGCGHRGIVNVIKQAKQVTGEEKICGVLGGFHLRKLEQQKEIIDNTIEYFKQNNINNIYLGHCVTDDVIDYFEQQMPMATIFRLATGKEFIIEE